MLENENKIEEVAQEEPTLAEPVQPEILQTESVTPQPQEEAYQAKNFRMLREDNERLAKKHAEMEQKLKTYETAKPEQPEDEPFNVADDDLVEGKHFSKVLKKVRNLEAQIKKNEAYSAQTVAETRLKSQYPDLDTVLSKDNITTLKEAYPELANTINSSANLYDKAVSAYTMIKKLGIYKEDVYQAERERAHMNSSKPRPLTSVSPQQGDSPLARANAFAGGLTDELKAQLHKEMIESMK